MYQTLFSHEGIENIALPVLLILESYTCAFSFSGLFLIIVRTYYMIKPWSKAIYFHISHCTIIYKRRLHKYKEIAVWIFKVLSRHTP